jgi:hypothetical protein
VSNHLRDEQQKGKDTAKFAIHPKTDCRVPTKAIFFTSLLSIAMYDAII